MSFLDTPEFRHSLSKEISQVTTDLQVVTAFCKTSALKFIDTQINHVLQSKRLLVRFLPHDILQNATDLEVYNYCKINGWEMYVRFDLHAKTYIFDRKRYILGSNNVTSNGFGLNGLGNFELATLSELQEGEMAKIDELFDSAILMTDELYSKMCYELSRKDSTNSGEYVSWDNEIMAQFHPNIDVLFTYDFPSTNVPKNEIGVYEFLEMSSAVEASVLRDKFRWSKAFLWLKEVLQHQLNKEIYFGELSAKLHDALINDPKPYRKEVKDLLANLLGWITYFNFDDIKIDRPNYSQRIRLL